MRLLLLTLILISCGEGSGSKSKNNPTTPSTPLSKSCATEILDKNEAQIKTLADVAEKSFHISKTCNLRINQFSDELNKLKGVQDE